MGFKFLTLNGWLETENVKEILFLLKEVAEHEEIRKSNKHVNALKHVIDILEYPKPKAWCTSSDSDVLRCPICLLRVPGDNPWREGDKIKPMNIFCQHADTIYNPCEFFECSGCGKLLKIVTLDGEVPMAKYHDGSTWISSDEIKLEYVGDKEQEKMNKRK